MGDFAYFLDQLELVLCRLYKVSSNIVICGDFNVNFLETTPRVHKLESLMASFRLFSTITFPTRNSDSSHTIIDNIFIDTNKFNYSVQPVTNSLLDHDAQIIVLPDIKSVSNNQFSMYTRTVNSNSTQKFIELLSYENWEGVFQDADVNSIFNTFQNIYLRIFQSSFPIRKKFKSMTSKPWITTGIKISCVNKSKLFQTYRHTKDPGFKSYYKKYCKILALTILAAKKEIL